MLEEKIRYVPVWSGALRAVHWLLAGGVTFQLASAWLAARETDAGFWRDWHLMVGQALVLVLALRVVLLFRPGTAGWRSFAPTRNVLRGARQTLVFYASLGRAPLPNWYAHNPLWQLVYPLMAVLLLVVLASGLAHGSPYLVAGAAPWAIHGAAAGLLGLVAALHVAAVVAHDLKGKGAFISAIINGNRYFHVTTGPDTLAPPGPGRSVDVRFDRAVQRPGNEEKQSRLQGPTGRNKP